MSNISIDISSQEYLQKTLRNSSLVLLQVFILNVTGILYFALAARLLPPYELGLLLISSVIINLFPILFGFAFPTAALKFCAEFLQKGKNSLSIGVAKIVLLLASFSFLISLTLGYLLTYLLLSPKGLSQIISSLVLLVAIDGSIQNMLIFFYGILLGNLKHLQGVFSASVANALRFIFATFIILSGGGVLDVLKVWILGDSIGLICFLIFLFPILKNRSFIKKNIIGSFFKFALPVYVSMILTYIFLYIDRYQILYNVTLERFAIYGTAITASMVFINIPQFITNALLPFFSHLFSVNKENLKYFLQTIIRIICFTFIPFIILIAMLAQPVLYIFAGEKYLEGWFPFFIVTLTVGLTFPIAVFLAYFLSIGKSKVIMITTLVAIIIGAISTHLLSNIYEIHGAAIGRSLLFIVNFLLLALWLYLKEKVNYGIKHHFKTSLLAIGIFSPLIILSVYQLTFNLNLLLVVLFSSLFIYWIILRSFKLLILEDLEKLLLILPSSLSKYVVKIFSFILMFNFPFTKKSSKILQTKPTLNVIYINPTVQAYIYIRPNVQ